MVTSMRVLGGASAGTVRSRIFSPISASPARTAANTVARAASVRSSSQRAEASSLTNAHVGLSDSHHWTVLFGVTDCGSRVLLRQAAHAEIGNKYALFLEFVGGR